MTQTINHRSNTRIREVECFRAKSPLSRPVADSTHKIDEISFVVTRLHLDNGVTGESYLLSFDYSPAAIAGALKDLTQLAIGFHASDTGKFLESAENESEYFGHAGINRWAMGSVNIAMWDAWARTLGIPVARMFGSYRKSIPLYGSGGWLSYSIEELIEEVTEYRDRGFRAVKIKVGSSEMEQDVERLVKVRESVGDSLDIMMDANQGMSVSSATQLVNAVRDLRISWFEEPVANTDYDGYRTLRSRSDVSIAMGEREYDLTALKELISRNAIDLWQPDLLRLGSVEAWRASANLAAAYHLPVLPHYYKEYDVPLLTTIPNAYGAESFDWVDPIITNPLTVDEGLTTPRDEPGWGFRFKDSFLSEL